MNKPLTHSQIVDWLIYHCPLEQSAHAAFCVKYRPVRPMLGWAVEEHGDDPLQIYETLAHTIINYQLHQEITMLYWYWTIPCPDF